MDQIYADKLMEFTSSLGFSEVTAQKFIELGEIVEIKRKDFLVRQGETCRYIATMLEGEFRFTYEKNDGKEPMVIAFKTNGFVTEYHSFLRQIPAKYSIIAQTDTVVCRVTHQ